jgi:hypothetical protein
VKPRSARAIAALVLASCSSTAKPELPPPQTSPLGWFDAWTMPGWAASCGHPLEVSHKDGDNPTLNTVGSRFHESWKYACTTSPGASWMITLDGTREITAAVIDAPDRDTLHQLTTAFVERHVPAEMRHLFIHSIRYPTPFFIGPENIGVLVDVSESPRALEPEFYWFFPGLGFY